MDFEYGRTCLARVWQLGLRYDTSSMIILASDVQFVAPREDEPGFVELIVQRKWIIDLDLMEIWN